MELFLPALIDVDAPPRGGGAQAALTFNAQSINASFAWGSAPGTATIVYIGATGITRGSRVLLTIGAHFFAGICLSDTENVGSGGNTRALQFVDFREYLTWDYTFCAFNRSVRRTVNGVRRKQYRHIYPLDSGRLVETYTATPLLAWEMVAAILAAKVAALGGTNNGTIGSPWSWDFTGGGQFPSGVMNYPVYDFDALGGKRLDAALNEICGRIGVVFTLVSTPLNYYQLVFARKGYGTLPTFPTSSDDRNLGQKLSGHPTNVRILGERNLYQYLDVPLVADWAGAWEQYFQVELFAEDLFLRATDPVSGQRYNALSGDTEQFIGRNLAMERALRMTVREYVALRTAVPLSGDTAVGSAFADYRLFAGRSRMDMPASLYIQTLLFRAFKPSWAWITNRAGETIPLDQVMLSDRQLCRVSHHLTSGAMTAYPNDPVEGNGYAITKGFQVGEEFLRQIKPANFDATLFAEAGAKRIWSTASFQIDNSGDGSNFVIFDQPLVVSTNLMITVNGLNVINAAATLTVPAVKAALTFEAERYSKWVGTWPNVSRDAVENVPTLRMECVVQGATFTEIPFEDGTYAGDQAQEIAYGVLACQYVYAEGGYKWIWSPATPANTFGVALSSMIDRVVISSSAQSGTYLVVDFASERERDHFEPERDLERRTVQSTLYPGQLELRERADQYGRLAGMFKQMPKAVTNLLVRFLRGEIQPGQVSGPVWFKPRAGGIPNTTMLAGTPIRGTKTSLATYPLDVVPATDMLFLGVTVRENEPVNRAFPLQNSGMGYARVMGPVNENDLVGLASTATDYLVKDGTPSVGRVLAKRTEASVALLPVLFGAGGGGGVTRYRIKVESADYFGCVTWNGTTEGASTVLIAKPPKLRRSILTETLEGVIYDYTYLAGPDALNHYRVAKIRGSTVEYERCLVTPEWILNDEIYALNVDTGVAGVSTLMLNLDGRAWAVHL